MFAKVLSLVCIFIIRLRFPATKSISDILRKRYGAAVVKSVRKFERLDFKKKKAMLDISFLETCLKYDIYPKFIQFRTANKNLKKSVAYKECQKILLEEELEEKRRKLHIINKDFDQLKSDLHDILSYFDFLHVTSLFFIPNRIALEKIEEKQNIKLSKLLVQIPKHDPKQIIHNFSNHILTPDQESLLIKGLNFALPPKKLKYEDYMLNFELLFRDISKLETKNEDLLFAKTNLRNITYSSFKCYK